MLERGEQLQSVLDGYAKFLRDKRLALQLEADGALASTGSVPTTRPPESSDRRGLVVWSGRASLPAATVPARGGPIGPHSKRRSQSDGCASALPPHSKCPAVLRSRHWTRHSMPLRSPAARSTD